MTEVTTATPSAPTVAGRSAEFWGYLMWGLAGIVIAVPELAAVFDLADWPTISATIGHLEDGHSWVRLVVVFVIVVLAYYSLPQLAMPPQQPATVAGRQTTANGRLTPDPDAVRTEGMGGYLVLACAALAAAVAFAGGARAVDPGTFTGAYVLYGTIAVMWVILPSVLSMFFAREVPFPTLFRTIGYLEHRAGFVAALLLGLLAILLIHLALYPWPRVTG
ncbi:hypothetical protein A5780_36860 [Nocardia sp. 852002-20019_SCH5090214]|jgi:hypothetical protein|uniref:Uncharacterized protein n=2 Tax=Nocardia nova TaxID=37330 RepID=A0A2S6A3W6_9NOCA|nr:MULTISPECIES: hypothetical protein [Nocardia]OBF68556.1 hypothetical protein A9X06_33665 [Mycobacterium sp. 852002-51759_SCH5129042]MBF6145710.1 hypothetical protein [Nocardia nova]MBF6274015.1 hypothetical protein [Nocardia nova]MBV7706590.1 hypothetical protein [Nocardia nova]OBA44530.1 hypothetical protein A5780_36860 [Nocardia sp. 852002-20019_SCH5090214]